MNAHKKVNEGSLDAFQLAPRQGERFEKTAVPPHLFQREGEGLLGHDVQQRPPAGISLAPHRLVVYAQSNISCMRNGVVVVWCGACERSYTFVIVQKYITKPCARWFSSCSTSCPKSLLHARWSGCDMIHMSIRTHS